MDNIIRIARSLNDLTGKGTEYWIREDGTVAAKFYNGNIVVGTPIIAVTDPTVTVA